MVSEGAAIAMIVLPPTASKARLVLTTASFAVIANIPDFQLPGWGHTRYDISHSIFTGLAIMVLLLIALISISGAAERLGGRRGHSGWLCRWLSHLLLDSFYGHGYGVCLLWPFSRQGWLSRFPGLQRSAKGCRTLTCSRCACGSSRF